MDATVQDPRLPGGVATGKIIESKLEIRGDDGMYICTTKIGACIGEGNSLGALRGGPTYAQDGYMEDGYQVMIGQTNITDSADVTYTPPVAQVVDDGLVFPLTKDQAVLANNVIGNADNQAVAITELIAFLQQGILQFGQFLTPQQQLAREIWVKKQIQQIGFQFSAERAAQYILSLRGINGGPFGAVYRPTLSTLSLPLGIDLSASS